MAVPTTEARSSIRERYRAQVQDEVKQVALRQLAEGGPGALSVNAIARELGLSGPALYRYFPSRDALLTVLVVDAYRDLTAAERAATAAEHQLGPVDRVRALTAAYRKWATTNPHRYRLLFREPLPGYDAHAEELVAAAQDLMAVVLEVIDSVTTASRPGGESSPKSDWVGDEGWARNVPPGTNAEPHLGFRGVVLWARLHGLVDLELNGNYASMQLDPDVLFDYEIEQLISGH